MLETICTEENPSFQYESSKILTNVQGRYYVTNLISGGRIVLRKHTLSNLMNESEAQKYCKEFDQQFPHYKERCC